MARRTQLTKARANSTLLLLAITGLMPSCVETTGSGPDAGLATAPNPNQPQLEDGGAADASPSSSARDAAVGSAATATTSSELGSGDPAQTGANFGLHSFGGRSDAGTPSSGLGTTTAGESSATYSGAPTPSADSSQASTPTHLASTNSDSTSSAPTTRVYTGETNESIVPACGPCPVSDDPCASYVCNTLSGSCELVVDVGADCDDGDSCTEGDECDGAGRCQGESKDCSHLDDQCLTGSCNAASGECRALPAHEQEACNDDDPCTVDDTCDAVGGCNGAAKDCSQYDQVCVRGVCNPESGVCQPEDLDNGSPCDDLSTCTTNDVCKGGLCGGLVPDTCSSGGSLDLTSGSVSKDLDTACVGVFNDFDVATYIPAQGRPPEAGDCDQSMGPDAFLLLDLSSHSGLVRVQASTDQPSTLFDTVLILMGAETSSDRQCGYTRLTACSDDLSNDKKQSRIDVTVAAGVYALVVDGYIESKKGPVGLSVTVTPQ